MRVLLTESRKDRVATVMIRGGGIMVIVVVAAIVLNIGLQALPLFFPARGGTIECVDQGAAYLAAGSDPRREILWALTGAGAIVFPSTPERMPLRPYGEATEVVAADHEIHGLLSMLSVDGTLAVGRVRFRDMWRDGTRETSARWRESAESHTMTGSGPWRGVTANADSDGNLVAAAWTHNGDLSLAEYDAEDGLWRDLPRPALGIVVRVAIAEELESMAVVTAAGSVRILRLPGVQEAAVDEVPTNVRTARFLIGGGSLVTGGAGGEVGVLLRVPRVTVHNDSASRLTLDGRSMEPGEEGIFLDDEVGRRLASRPAIRVTAAAPVWREVRRLPPLAAATTKIAPSHRRRGFLVGAEDGVVALYHSTSGRRLLSDQWGELPVRTLALNPKGDGAVVMSGTDLLRRELQNPHPEVSLRTLFLPVWYEGYAGPKWVWQSTGGSDAFEPKMSLWPLIFGTLKATLYAMLISVPLALMAAVYVSQLAPSWLQSLVKPTLELMAAVPSVVVGFLAALWLAPRLEAALLSWILGLAALPLGVGGALLVWRLLPGVWRRRVSDGGELVVLAVSCATVVWAAVAVAGPLEQWLFNGDFQRFLFTEWGMRYDQRNSIVVGLALGFAVIPVIFTIAEDACSAVPQNLLTASTALGATRWQTAVRLVVPAASPGLFAAIMLGFGRAVGETMIVLMAAGNTPVLEMSIFNGMRTMSAAIAVEIPEAPVGGSLFRILFLTGTLLFVFTLILTTAADVVGSYLRRRYARF